jgi:hypothetical protein
MFVLASDREAGAESWRVHSDVIRVLDLGIRGDRRSTEVHVRTGDSAGLLGSVKGESLPVGRSRSRFVPRFDVGRVQDDLRA